MKKYIYPIISMLLGIVFIIGCSDEEMVRTVEGVRVTASIASETPEGRTVYEQGENSVSVSWAASDAIGIMSVRQSDALKYVATTGGKTTDFLPAGASLKEQEGEEIVAFYPFEENQTEMNYPYVVLREMSNQYYNGEQMRPESDFMLAKGTVNEGQLHLQFKHLFAFLRITIRTELIKDSWGIQLHSTEPIACWPKDGQALCYDLNGDNIVGDKSTYLWYGISQEAVANRETVTCYVAVLPSSENNVITLVNNPSDGSQPKGFYEKKAPAGGFKAGHVYDLKVNENNFTEMEKKEREALIALYKATDGDNWKNNDNWCSDKPLSEWYGVSVWGEHVRGLNLSVNNLTGNLPQSFTDLAQLEYLYLDNNELTGCLLSSLASLTQIRYLNLCGNKFTGAVPDEILQSDVWKDMLDKIVYQKDGVVLSFPMYESTDYSRHKTVEPLQIHSVGKGLKLVIMGEAYTDRMIADGSFLRDAKVAMEAFFMKEPYTSFRNRFDVYALNLVSKNDHFAGSTVFETSYEFDRGTFETNSMPVVELIQTMPETNYQTAHVSSIIIMNTQAPFRANCHTWSDGFSAAFCTHITDEGLQSLVHHESCGHGFGKLADEYTEFEGAYPDPQWITESHLRNEDMNVDITSDPDAIAWSYFLTDMRYAKEGIGIFEGAVYYPKGVYRATENSIMRYHSLEDRFNAPSRLSIYRRIKELSGETYSFEEFLEYDEVTRRAIEAEGGVARSVTAKPEKHLIGAPPVYHNYPASEEGQRGTGKRPIVVPLR